MAKITVIVPVYNVEDYLSYCIDSILQQTFKDFDLILVDDGSTDNSGVICDEYSKKDNRINVIHKNNGGVSSTRNKGIDWSINNSDSEWITFIDADDWVDLNYLNIMLSYCNNADIVTCGFQTVYKPFDRYSLSESDCWIEHIGTKILGNVNLNPCWAKIYKKTAIINCSFDEEIILGEDKVFNIDVMANNQNLVIHSCGEKLYYYYQRNNSAIHSISDEKLLYMCKTLVERGNRGGNAGIYYITAGKHYLSNRYRFSLHSDKKIYRKCNKELLLLVPKIIKVKWPIVDKIKLLLSIIFPQAYRWYRVKHDYNMLIWEKNMKEVHG